LPSSAQQETLAVAAKRASDGFSTDTSSLTSETGVGTPEWMAPEMTVLASERSDLLRGSISGLKSADVYSFGICMWELLTRRRPKDGFNVQSPAYWEWELQGKVGNGIRPALPASQQYPVLWVQLLQQCWSHDASKRPGFPIVVGRLDAMVKEKDSIAHVKGCSQTGCATGCPVDARWPELSGKCELVFEPQQLDSSRPPDGFEPEPEPESE